MATETEIHQAADAILNRGENPTLAKVREQLGSGSFSTISPILKAWREKREAEKQPKAIIIPDDVRHVGAQAIESIYKAALSAAQSQLQHERDRLQLEREQMKEAEQEAADMADQMDAEIQSLTAEKAELLSELESALEKLNTLKSQQEQADKTIVVLTATNGQLGSQVDKLERKNNDLERELIEIARGKVKK